MADDTQTVDDEAAPAPDRDVVSSRTARNLWLALGILVVVVVVAIGAVSGQKEKNVRPAPKAFCKAAKAYERELDHQAKDYELDLARQIEKVQVIADTAPKDVRADAALFLRQLQRLEAAPDAAARAKLQDDPDVKRAVDNVNRRWNQGCGVFKRDSSI